MNHEFHPCPKPIILTAEEAEAEMAAASAPLPLAGGGVGRHVTPSTGGPVRTAHDGALDGGDMPSPNPSREREGDQAERTWRSIDFTPPRRALFLHHLAEQGNVRAAASRVGISPSSAYLARRRDAVFRAGWDAALVHSREHALQVLACQALDGVREEMWHRGELVGHRVRHDTRLLLAHLGRLDARCKDARAVARAERFDELLALVAGEDYAWTLCDDRLGAGDEVLPLTRTGHSNRAADMAYHARPDDDPEQIDHDELIAREEAEAEWDEWGARVDAVNDALEAGEEPVVSPAPPEPFDAAPAADAEPPYEVKSLDAAAAIRAAGRGRDYFARTVCGSSTWSPAARFSGDRAMPRGGFGVGGGEGALAAGHLHGCG